MDLRVRWFREIAEIPEEAWDALAVPLAVPTLEWEWLRQLEVSGSIRPETGWLPLHLTLWRGSELVGAAPLYAKSHSAGEFVWDHVWADVASQLGIPYYPKLVGMSPATPVPGYRFLTAPGEDGDELTDRMVAAVERLCARNDLAGVSFPYVDPEWRPALEARGFLAWRHQSFRWENPGFASFDEYLAAFDHNQRRNIRRERRSVARAGIQVRALTGDGIRQADLAAMHAFYDRTNDRFGPWAARYLNGRFFSGLFDAYRHRVLLFAAHRGDPAAPIAMSFLLVKGDRLFGRYWGSVEDVDGLHFELCYYGPIEWVIARRARWFDPGIGGGHKVRRGFRAVPNHSLHRFADARLQQIMAEHLDRINDAEQERIEALNRGIPLAEGRGNERSP